jgi:flagellar hook-associated protein 2
MAVSVDGIVSGIDTSALIKSILSASGIPKAALQSRVSEYEDRLGKYTTLDGLLGDLEDALEDLETGTDFRSYAASYEEDNGVFTATADGSAAAGVYDLVVSQLAQGQQTVSSGVSAKSTAGVVKEGTFSISYGGSTHNITIGATSTLSSIASDISDIDGLTASVINTGDSVNPYRLSIQSDDPGADNSFTISATYTGSSGSELTFTDTVSAEDAELTINGISVTSSSNSLTDTITGLSIDLLGTNTTAKRLTVASDPDAIADKVQAFVDAYNEVIDHIKTNQVFDSDAGIKGVYVGESAVRRIQQNLLSAVTERFDLDQNYEALSQLGIESDGKGKLTFDEDTFKDVLASEPDQVEALFTDEDGFVQSMLETIDVFVDPVDGTIVNRQDSLEERIADFEDQIERYDRRLTLMETRLRNQFSVLESLLGKSNSSSQYLAALTASSS